MHQNKTVLATLVLVHKRTTNVNKAAIWSKHLYFDPRFLTVHAEISNTCAGGEWNCDHLRTDFKSLRARAQQRLDDSDATEAHTLRDWHAL